MSELCHVLDASLKTPTTHHCAERADKSAIHHLSKKGVVLAVWHYTPGTAADFGQEMFSAGLLTPALAYWSLGSSIFYISSACRETYLSKLSLQMFELQTTLSHPSAGDIDYDICILHILILIIVA